MGVFHMAADWQLTFSIHNLMHVKEQAAPCGVMWRSNNKPDYTQPAVETGSTWHC